MSDVRDYDDLPDEPGDRLYGKNREFDESVEDLIDRADTARKGEP